ncbi:MULTISPECIES: hypothetical protein [unclassified Colwellia]|uniref:hypothetical protein n=1 Tax=unclassified Colwellia TaxID=196834 RepID=UPI0015F3EDE7|nr:MULTISPECIES: hypothetical protein [unclassified Colwellia]MBA6257387.1 hypothetical protein [Colwellia sp. MB3u-28]MBA6260459.1 hypothetical protein [Colwellia sp. MB3u-41]
MLATRNSPGGVRLLGFASVSVGKILNETGVENYGVPVTFLADNAIVSAYAYG